MGVITVHERKVHASTRLRKVRQQRREQLPARAGVQDDVGRERAGHRLVREIDRVDLGAVGGDPRQASALGRSDLERELGAQLGEDALDRGPLAK